MGPAGRRIRDGRQLVGALLALHRIEDDLRSVRDQGREEESDPLVRVLVRSPSCLRGLVKLTNFLHIYDRGIIGTIFAMPQAQVTFGVRNRGEGGIRG